ncbi:RNA polymerase sigma factor [Terracidiphilus gabretensis]|uniref:sigma-70 family RNA polymerase sigma factor n=1 Tax=Terracidiphilus gabretensis TaxID=1577687 RepID=UPI00071B82C1|nr:sigma-70 family RNA polymerase sigma factor [Terracidiphilus gabretensis]
MSIIEVKVIAAIRRWCYDSAKLVSGRGNNYQHRGFQRRDERSYDARQVRVLDFERAFSKLPEQNQVLLLLAHRDGISECELAAMISVSPNSMRRWLMDTRIALATLLEHQNAL